MNSTATYQSWFGIRIEKWAIYNPPKWRNILIEQELDRDCYFDFMEVRHVMNEHGTTVNYRGYWIGVGDDTIFKNNHRKHSTPSTQFRSFNNPPRMQRKYNITKKIKLAYKVLLLGQQEEKLITASSHIENDSVDVGSLQPVLKSSIVMQNNSRQTLSKILDEFKLGNSSKEDTIELIIKTIKELEKEKCKKIMASIITNNKNDNDNEHNNLEEKEELISDYREKTKFTPFLAQFGIPLHKDVIGVCLQEIVKLSRRFPKEKIFQYRNWNGILCNVVSVPVWIS